MTTLRKNFTTKVNGLYKSFRSVSEEVVTENGYTDIMYKLSAKSDMITDNGSLGISVEISLLDGVVYDVKFRKFADGLNIFERTGTLHDTYNAIIADIEYLMDSWYGIKDYNFAYSILGVVLSLQSYDSQTQLYNDTVYDLLEIA